MEGRIMKLTGETMPQEVEKAGQSIDDVLQYVLNK